jgi:hypothetical protein
MIFLIISQRYGNLIVRRKLSNSQKISLIPFHPRLNLSLALPPFPGSKDDLDSIT